MTPVYVINQGLFNMHGKNLTIFELKDLILHGKQFIKIAKTNSNFSTLSVVTLKE